MRELVCLWLCEGNEKNKKYCRREQDGGWVEVGGILGEGQNCLSTLSLQQPGELIML